MSYTKRQFVTKAFEKAGMAAYVYDLEPEQLQSALQDLDSMVATWNAEGIRLGYPIPSSPEESSLDEETNVPDSANMTIICNLAALLAPNFGKTVSMSVSKFAKDGYDALCLKAVYPGELKIPSAMPLGAGKKPWISGRQFFGADKEKIDVGPDGHLDFS